MACAGGDAVSKDANPGELRTPVIVEAYTQTINSNGYPVQVWENVFGINDDGTDKYLRVKWVNLHGSEVWEAMSHDLKEPATLTSRYTPLLTETCRILKEADLEKRDALVAAGKQDEADALYFEVISLDNVEETGEWLEANVQRMVRAK